MLGELQDSFNNLEQGSRNMAAQVSITVLEELHRLTVGNRNRRSDWLRSKQQKAGLVVLGDRFQVQPLHRHRNAQ